MLPENRGEVHIPVFEDSEEDFDNRSIEDLLKKIDWDNTSFYWRVVPNRANFPDLLRDETPAFTVQYNAPGTNKADAPLANKYCYRTRYG